MIGNSSGPHTRPSRDFDAEGAHTRKIAVSNTHAFSSSTSNLEEDRS